MRNRLILLIIVLANVGFWIWYSYSPEEPASQADKLRAAYTADISEWPEPTLKIP